MPRYRSNGAAPADNAMGKLPLLAEFLEEQLWALRDRADALQSVALSEPMAVDLAVVVDGLTDAALLLRRPTRTNREGVTILLGQMRKKLDTIERDAWQSLPAG